MRYIYKGDSVNSVALKTKEKNGTKTVDVVLVPKQEYDLPDDHPHVQRLVNRGLLEKLPATAKKGGK